MKMKSLETNCNIGSVRGCLAFDFEHYNLHIKQQDYPRSKASERVVEVHGNRRSEAPKRSNDQ